MIDGMWWLVILLAVVVGLWLLAKSRAPKVADKNSPKSTGMKTPINDALQKTSELLKQHFPDYRVNRKTNHLLISKHDKKIAMITIDKKIAAGQRRLGDVPVINYHRVPSRAQLTANLQDTE
ncbi:hypothetical protein [Psychrobacter maritimus]|uniref:hypothetical protein n=1 Tax=Psychrobacter maritimus TaxID=256325 RepID=UPI00191ADD01|nr:hypothetical protein [Psychrobacter maritimus]